MPEKPDENSQKKLKKLRDAKPEDNQYVAMQVSAHKDSVSLFQRSADGGADAKFEGLGGIPRFSFISAMA
ncbi:DUF4142 domain-containing protein [Bradyrhizobium arachidis]|uniref:DUF4142 domain-containing protein n=1 Tax=Bradyrhizobium arachidis TaxID=858423 RepID=UPI001FCCE46D|nr:DUF4142 domain-containing protein [Bradyrhizobium arachidis]